MSVRQRIRFLIIGAGPAGLGAASALSAAGEKDFLVVEKDLWPGGLAASFRDRKGFTWDLGGHVIHSHYADYDRVLDGLIPAEGWVSHRREAWIYYPEGWIPYPFQLHLDWLPPDRRERCLEGLRLARPVPAADFREWMLTRLGEGITALFMDPYNRKVWRTDPRRMGVYWLDDRVAARPPAAKPAGKPALWGPNASFRFPRKGGTGEICRLLAGSLGRGKVRYGWEAAGVDTGRRLVAFRNGRELGYDVLFSTAPLDLLARSCRPRIKETRAIPGRLAATPVAVIGLGLKGPRPAALDRVTWMYLPQPETRIYRLTHFSRYSPLNVPDRPGLWSVMLELSALPLRVDLPRLAKKAEEDVRRCGLLPAETEVVSRWSRLLPYGYPVPLKDRESVRPALLAALAGRSVYSRGRFGAWMYEAGNMDHSLMQGREWAGFILTGAREATIGDPAGINRGAAK